MNRLFRHWPVRWRIAAVSAGLTLLILLGFALIVGRLATDKLKGDFEDEIQATANNLAIQRLLDPGNPLQEAVMASEGPIRIVDEAGIPYPNTPAIPDLGPPQPGESTQVGNYEVASQRIFTPETGLTYYVQYAETRESLDSTVGRVWLLLAGGVLGGTILALLAGLAVAQRAMRPIAGLTSAAREIAMTRDPSMRLPAPDTDDEVAELARTLDQMLGELDAARAETQTMIQAQRDFVADASHELRTPLTSILANLELLEASLAARDADPEEEEIVAGALGSSRRMRRLVSDLLLLARADAGRAGPRRRCDLVVVATAAVAEARAVGPDHEIGLTGDESVTVDGNPDDLHRLVLNLLENAVRHTPPGTPVRVAITGDGDRALIEVADDGPGIPDDVGEQIFSRFVRGNGPADLASDPGTGLGLAIVRAVAGSHGGEVRLENPAGGGARFVVSLPLAAQLRPAEPAPVAEV